MRFTLSHIANSKVAGINQHLFPKTRKKREIGGRVITKHYPKKSGPLNYIEIALLDWCQKRGLKLYEEYVFSLVRAYRLDYALAELKLGIEYEGSIHKTNGDHRSKKGVQRDIEKGNLATQEGWRVLRFSALNYETILHELNKAYETQSPHPANL